jgi:uncharacterized membrane protein
MGTLNRFKPGRIGFASAMCGLGLLGAWYGDFALQWQPVPHTLPGYTLAAYASAALLLAGGIGLFIKSRAPAAALMLICYFGVFWLLPHAVRVAAAIDSLGSWLGFCEVLGVMAGAFLLWSAGAAPRVKRIGRLVFGLCCLVYGASHFVYADFTAAMIPHWLPQRPALAYLTGVGHALAGLALVINQLPRLAALLEAMMMTLFVVLLHLPSLWASPAPEWAPTFRGEVTPLFWATALAASAWLVYQSFAADE